MSVLSEAATVVGVLAEAGETLQAFVSSLPAATATNTPAFDSLSVAVLRADE